MKLNVRPLRSRCLSLSCTQKDRAAAGSNCSLDIAPRIPNEGDLGKRETEQSLRLEQQSSPGLAACAAILLPMGTNKPRIDRTPLGRDLLLDFPVNCLQCRGSEQPPSNTRLVCRDKNAIALFAQESHPFCCFRDYSQIFKSNQGAWKIDIQNTVTIEDHKRAHMPPNFAAIEVVLNPATSSTSSTRPPQAITSLAPTTSSIL